MRDSTGQTPWLRGMDFSILGTRGGVSSLPQDPGCAGVLGMPAYSSWSRVTGQVGPSTWWDPVPGGKWRLGVQAGLLQWEWSQLPVPGLGASILHC